MPPTALTGTVKESKSQRQERLKSRFRDRGGCVRACYAQRVLRYPPR